MKKFVSWIKNADALDKKVFTCLYSIAFVSCFIIAVSQVGLRNENTRSFFTKIDTYEGAYFEATAEITPEVKKEIILNIKGDCNEDSALYVNGEKYKQLHPGANEVEIDGTSVLEIYSPKGKIEAELVSISDELVLYTEDEKVIAENQLKFFARLGEK